MIDMDGSFYNKEQADKQQESSQSAWAFLVVVTIHGKEHFLGCLSGPVQTDFLHSHYIGINKHSASGAEDNAAVWSVAWACLLYTSDAADE